MSVLDRIGMAGIGLGLMCCGLIATSTRKFYSDFHAQYFDFTEYHRFIGVAMIALGGFFAYRALRRRDRKV